MAEKYRGSFVSKKSLDAEKNNRRSYLEQELERARNEFESKKRQKELQKQRGETTWMLPSLSKRLKQDEEKAERSKHKKKKHEKKEKKRKKEKKHKKKNSPPECDSSGESSGDDWVEKAKIGDPERESHALGNDISTKHNIEQMSQSHEKTKRESWMMSDSFLDAVVSSSESLADKRAKKMEERKMFMKPMIDELGQHPNELNPYWKNGGSGVPTEQLERGSEPTRGYKVCDAGLSWVKKAFERAREQAEEQGRSLEDVVAERWGSMEKLKALMRNEERRKRRTVDKESQRGWKSREVGDGQLGHTLKISGEARVAGVGNSFEGRDEKPKQKCSQESKFNDEPTYSGLKIPDQLEVKKVHERHVNQSEQTSSTPTMEQSGPTASTSESDSNESGDSEDETRQCTKLVEPLSEKEVNEISAKILRAELLGDQELADNLKAKLEAGRQSSVKSTPRIKTESKGGSRKTEEEEEVVITRTDRHGNLYPLKVSGEEPEPRKKKRKTKAIETHDVKGNRLRYFQEDDVTDLKAMVEEERLTTSEDHQMAVISRLTKKLGSTVSDHYTLDDMFETSSAASQSQATKDEKTKKRAIAEQQKAMAKQASCRFCFDHPDVAKHLIISIASHVYLALPITSSLTEGHCLIIPMQHAMATTFLDENVIEEVMKFKSSLVRMFKEKNQDVIFLETLKNLKYQNHMFIECVPVPLDVGDVAPIYFKKAIEESESEWAQNQKLVDISKSKGIRSAIPKGLPYFAVEFGMDGGFAHVIEDEMLFQHYFGKEIIGGILDLEPMKWRRPPKESFQQHKRKVLKFSEMWEPFDWTRDL